MKNRRFLIGATSALALTAGVMPAASATFKVDGVADAMDMYTHQLLVTWQSDTSAVTGQSNVFIGRGANENGTGGPDDLFVYFEIPLVFKDNTWGNNSGNTHPDYAEQPIEFNGGQTGSEDVEFNFDNDSDRELNVKLSARGNSATDDILDCIATSDCVGHQVKDDAGGALLDQATSLDHIMNTYSVANGFNFDDSDPGNIIYGTLWGDMDKGASTTISQSPELADTTNYIPVNSIFDDWAWHQAYEMQFSLTGTDILTKLNANGGNLGALTIQDIFGDTVILHASPSKQGGNSDLTPMCLDDDSCDPFTPVSRVPVPAALPLLASGIAGLAALGFRRRKPIA